MTSCKRFFGTCSILLNNYPELKENIKCMHPEAACREKIYRIVKKGLTPTGGDPVNDATR